MSPVARKKKPKAEPQERTVPSRSGNSQVKITSANKKINVAWLCGGSRTFSVEELRKAIEHVDTLGAKAVIWINMQDDSGYKYWVQLKDNELTANESTAENGRVAWLDLKRELQATITEVLS